MPVKRETVETGTANVFRDLRLAEPGERQLRTRLAMQVNALIAERGLSQVEAAGILGVPQPHVSELKHYKLSRFSSERLLRFLTRMDRDVEIVIRPKASRRKAGSLSVSVA